MAVMGRKKLAVRQEMRGRRARENEFGNKVRENFKQEVTPEEHKKRLDMLKGMGLLKEEENK